MIPTDTGELVMSEAAPVLALPCIEDEELAVEMASMLPGQDISQNHKALASFFQARQPLLAPYGLICLEISIVRTS